MRSLSTDTNFDDGVDDAGEGEEDDEDASHGRVHGRFAVAAVAVRRPQRVRKIVQKEQDENPRQCNL